MYVKISLIILVILILSPVIFILYFVYRDYFSGGVRGLGKVNKEREI